LTSRVAEDFRTICEVGDQKGDGMDNGATVAMICYILLTDLSSSDETYCTTFQKHYNFSARHEAFDTEPVKIYYLTIHKL